MSIQATSPFQVYLDSDGTPLSQGYVYFGVSGANPETTPQAVYWDEALTIPAAQPIRTLSGFIVRNGSPSNVYMANVYSVLVRNKNGVLLYSSLVNPGVPVSAAMVPVMSAATLEIAREALGVSKKIKGYQAISISHLPDYDIQEPLIQARSEIEVDATFYEFPMNEAAVAGGWAAIGASTLVYMYIVPAGAAHTWIYSTTAPTWDISKQGWYAGANRCFGGLYKDAGGNYTAKWLFGSNPIQGSPFNVRHGTVVFTSGTGATWKCPIEGTYKITVVGGGAGGGGCSAFVLAGCGGGGAGGMAISSLFEIAGAVLTYTVGPNGSGSLGAAGGNGTTSTLTDGTATLIGAGGTGAPVTVAGTNEGSAPGGPGGSASGGKINVNGAAGKAGLAVGPNEQGHGGMGGSGQYGAGGRSPTVGKNTGLALAGNNATGHGGGGSGAVANQSSALAGGDGSPGVIIIEY